MWVQVSRRSDAVTCTDTHIVTKEQRNPCSDLFCCSFALRDHRLVLTYHSAQHLTGAQLRFSQLGQSLLTGLPIPSCSHKFVHVIINHHRRHHLKTSNAQY